MVKNMPSTVRAITSSHTPVIALKIRRRIYDVPMTKRTRFSKLSMIVLKSAGDACHWKFSVPNQPGTMTHILLWLSTPARITYSATNSISSRRFRSQATTAAPARIRTTPVPAMTGIFEPVTGSAPTIGAAAL